MIRLSIMAFVEQTHRPMIILIILGKPPHHTANTAHRNWLVGVKKNIKGTVCW